MTIIHHGATGSFELGVMKGQDKLTCVIPYCGFLLQKNELSNIKPITTGTLKKVNPPSLGNLITRITLIENVSESKKEYVLSVLLKFMLQYYLKRLTEKCLLLANINAELDLINKRYSRWINIGLKC